MGNLRDEIAKNMLFYRKRAGLTQKELADQLGVRNTAVSNWESGNNSIDIDTLVLACSNFGITLNDMYGKFSATPTLSDDESMLLSAYRSMNQEGKEKLLDYSEDLVSGGRYKKEGSTVSNG